MDIRSEFEASRRDKVSQYECSPLIAWRMIGGSVARRRILGIRDYRDGVVFLRCLQNSESLIREFLNEVAIIGLADSVKEPLHCAGSTD